MTVSFQERRAPDGADIIRRGLSAGVLRRLQSAMRRSPSAATGAVVLVVIVLVAIFGPAFLAADPLALNPRFRLQPASAQHWFGTDMFGRDVWGRLIYGARTSVFVGASVAILSVIVGLAIGLVAGYVRLIDAVVMRIMDGLMSIPGVLLAIAMIAVSGASLTTLIVAITVPDIPRVVRLVRSIVLSVREEPYVEGAIAAGTPVLLILVRHVLPSTVAPLVVLGSYLASSAVLIEAGLSFLGAGLPPEIPSWGNMIAEGRAYLQIRPELVFVPGVALALTILSVNVLGDGLRDEFDPRRKQQT